MVLHIRDGGFAARGCLNGILQLVQHAGGYLQLLRSIINDENRFPVAHDTFYGNLIHSVSGDSFSFREIEIESGPLSRGTLSVNIAPMIF